MTRLRNAVLMLGALIVSAPFAAWWIVVGTIRGGDDE